MKTFRGEVSGEWVFLGGVPRIQGGMRRVFFRSQVVDARAFRRWPRLCPKDDP